MAGEPAILVDLMSVPRKNPTKSSRRYLSVGWTIPAEFCGNCRQRGDRPHRSCPGDAAEGQCHAKIANAPGLPGAITRQLSSPARYNSSLNFMFWALVS